MQKFHYKLGFTIFTQVILIPSTSIGIFLAIIHTKCTSEKYKLILETYHMSNPLCSYPTFRCNFQYDEERSLFHPPSKHFENQLKRSDIT